MIVRLFLIMWIPILPSGWFNIAKGPLFLYIRRHISTGQHSVRGNISAAEYRGSSTSFRETKYLCICLLCFRRLRHSCMVHNLQKHIHLEAITPGQWLVNRGDHKHIALCCYASLKTSENGKYAYCHRTDYHLESYVDELPRNKVGC